jgi:hypothetical protein
MPKNAYFSKYFKSDEKIITSLLFLRFCLNF